jgi:hypothetical protein
MWMAIGLGVAALVGVAVALLIAARGQATEEPIPWNVNDLARLQASIMAMLGGVSITGIVIVIGFISNRSNAPGAAAIDSLALMFAVSFSYFLQSAYTLSYLPDRAVVGERLFRFYYALCSTLQFRTILLLICALMNFGEFFGLSLTGNVLAIFVPLMVIGVFVIMAVVSDSLGLFSFGECFVAAAVGVLLAAIFYGVMRWLQLEEPFAQITMTLTFAAVNGLSFVAVSLAPLAPRRPGLQSFLTRNARRFAAIDMQTTIVSMIFLWMAVARLV